MQNFLKPVTPQIRLPLEFGLYVLLVFGMSTEFAFGQVNSDNGVAGNFDGANPTSIAFKTHGQRFVAEFCVECHGPDTQEGELRLDKIGHDISVAESAQTWDRIVAQLQFDKMPPSESKQPTAAARAEFLKVIDAEMVRYGRGSGLEAKCECPSMATMSIMRRCSTEA